MKNKFSTIALFCTLLVLTGCSSLGPTYQVKNQTHGSGTHVYTQGSDSTGEILRGTLPHAVRVPQQASFMVEWLTITDYSRRTGLTRLRLGCTIHIQPGGSFTSGSYPCGKVDVRGASWNGDRIITFTDPQLGTMSINLSMFNGGYLQSEACDRWDATEGTYKVQWSTHDTIRGRNGFWTQLNRTLGCESASREEARFAKRMYREAQREMIRQQRAAYRRN